MHTPAACPCMSCACGLCSTFPCAPRAVADPNLIISKMTDASPAKVAWQAMELIVPDIKVIFVQRIAQVFYDHCKFLFGEVRRCFKEDVIVWVAKFDKDCGKGSLPVEWVDTTESLLKFKFPQKAAFDATAAGGVGDSVRPEVPLPFFVPDGAPLPQSQPARPGPYHCTYIALAVTYFRRPAAHQTRTPLLLFRGTGGKVVLLGQHLMAEGRFAEIGKVFSNRAIFWEIFEKNPQVQEGKPLRAKMDELLTAIICTVTCLIWGNLNLDMQFCNAVAYCIRQHGASSSPLRIPARIPARTPSQALLRPPPLPPQSKDTLSLCPC